MALALPLAAAACAAGDEPPAGAPSSAAPSRPASAKAAAATAPSRFDYPTTRRDTTSEKIFGTMVVDPYRWLEDGKSPEVQAWMKAEDAYARSRLAAMPGREAFAARLKELLYAPSQGIPGRRGTRLFYGRKDASQEKSVFYWRETETSPEKVLLDPNSWSADGSLSLHEHTVSWDGKTVAYAVSKNNNDETQIEVMDVATGKKSPIDVIAHVRYSGISWTAKGDAFVYSYSPVEASGKPIPDSERPAYAEIRKHVLGTSPDEDEVIHDKTGDPQTLGSADISEDGHWLVYQVDHGAAGSREDMYFRDLRSAKTARAPFVPLVVGHEATFNLVTYRDHFYIWTTDGAPNGKVVVVDPGHPDPASWKEIVPERKDQTISEMSIVGGKLSLGYRKDVVSHVEMHRLDGTLENEIALPGLGTASALSGRHDDPAGYFFYDSYTYPYEIFRYDVKTRKEASFFRQKLPLDPAAYASEQVFATSKDGTRVPLFLIHRKDVQKSRRTPLPTILYGYGGFNVSITPDFWGSAIPWLDRGGVMAVANLRGGSEYGESWHRAGMRHDKQHVFDDAIAAGEWLVREGWTDPAHLAIRGGSNGGLLVGALVTERPDLFRVGLCGVPLLDMLRYDRFGAGQFWVEEYGSPANADDFAALYAYSPYHHVTPGGDYPAVLFLSADSDDRVDPLHARKMAALLQADSRGGPVLLRIEKNSGHGGADTVKSSIDKTADEYAFALANMPPGAAR